MANGGDLEDRVRARLQQVRFERGLTLAQVAGRAGMATSTLSRLESGARSIRLAHLPALAAGLGVDTDALIAAGSREPAPASDGKTWWPLTHEGPESLRAYRIRFPGDLTAPSLGSHEGHVWMLVLSGRLRVVTQARDAVLRAGDATAFNTWIPHWVGVAGEPAEVLAVFSPSGKPIRPRDVA